MTETAKSLPNDTQARIVDALNQSLAETAVTTMLAQNFHWNVKGMAFGSLHALFQEIYEDHFAAQDDLAERVRALGGHAEGRLATMLERSKVAESDGHATDKEMISMMHSAQETLAKTLADAAETSAEAGDSLSEDLCIARGQVHEKFAWMMRAHLA
ncbi:DNA starvation/stationary phase protection protein [Sulfitobacter sp. HNIBRBA3233]|uniref:Dps family protein n=1 Tax=Sulfitobacter marinivivus TaxID=3158558 RepID=UPI0032DF1DCB